MTSTRLTLSGLNERLRGYDSRLTELESKQTRIDAALISAELADKAFEKADSSTAEAVDHLTQAINDPKTGLIVELSSFRSEVQADRRVLKAYIAGAVVILSVVWTLVLGISPLIQRFLLGPPA